MEFKYQTVSGAIIKEVIILLLCMIIFGKACHISFFIRLVVPRPFKKCTIGKKSKSRSIIKHEMYHMEA